MKSDVRDVSCSVSRSFPPAFGHPGDLEKNIEQMLLDCLRHVQAESGSLFLRLKKQTRLRLVKAIGPRENRHCGKIISIGEGVSGYVALKKEPLLVSDLAQDASLVPREGSSPGTFMSCPILNGSSVLAVVNVSGRKDGRSFRPEDLGRLQKLTKSLRAAVKEAVNYYSVADEGVPEREAPMISMISETPESIAENLEELRKYSSIVLHSLSRFVLVFDRAFRIVYCSNKEDFGRLFSRNGKKGLKQNVLDLPLDVERDSLRRKLESLLLQGSPFSLNNIRIKDATDISIVNMFFSPFLSMQGNLLGGLLLIDDNTKIHEMQQRLFEAEKFSFIGSLISMISHEVNVPLDGINRLINLSLDRLNGNSDGVREYLVEAQKGVQRISSLVTSLLAFSRKSSSLEVDFLPLTRVLDEAVSVCRNRNIGKNVMLHLNYGAEVVRINANDFYQITTNIIANAFDAVAPEGNVAVETAVEEERLCLIVRDDGCGIPKSMLPRLFEPFFSSKSLGRGTGLGLAIVKRLVEKYEGQIRVESEEGCGTSIHLTFPLDNVIYR